MYSRLLRYHSFGAKNSLQRQKNLLVKRINRGLTALSRFSPQLAIKFRLRNYRPNNKQRIRRLSLISDSESKIKKYA